MCFPDITEFETLMQKIHDLVKEKKFFLVLDDVWTKEAKEWDPFKFALNCGAQGSRNVEFWSPHVVRELRGWYIVSIRLIWKYYLRKIVGQ